MTVLDPHLQLLEAEAIEIFREVVAELENPVMLYSVGKDSSVMLHVALKAFYPTPPPFPLLHVDTGYKPAEMIAFRDRLAREHDFELVVHRNEQAIGSGANPYDLGTRTCCDLLKTQALLQALKKGRYDAAFGGARRDEERSRAKERIYSFRSRRGQWDPRAQRPELWNLYNGAHRPGESIRVFPLSNWTELDIWRYVAAEKIEIVPLYLARPRPVVMRDGMLVPVDDGTQIEADEHVETIVCRFRSLGCSPCTGAVRSSADTVEKIVEELHTIRTSERNNRAIDHDQDGSMELKKQQGYF